MAGVNSGIPTFYVQQFSSNIQLKLQQKGSRLRGAVKEGSHVGSQASPVDQFGAINGNKVTGRYQPMVHTDAPTDRRWVLPQDYDLNQLLDSFDKLRLITDPQSAYVENAVNALGRNIDQEILAACFGTNLTGVSAGTSTTFLSGQVVSVKQGAASSTALTVAKIREGKRLMMLNEVDLDNDPIYMAINAKAHDSLLAEVQVISRDYNPNPVMVEGKITRVLGVNLIHTELVAAGTDDQSGTSDALPMWAKSGLYLGMWADIMTDACQRKDLRSLPWQAYAKITCGATRLEEKKVVKIWSH